MPEFDFQDLEIAFVSPIPEYKDIIDLDSEQIDDFHLLVKLSIALLKPHYNTRLR